MSLSPKPKFVLVGAVLNYCESFIKYVNDYKIKLGRIK